MAKNNSMLGNTNKEGSVELFILDTLLKGENVVIPDIGHLELKTLGERRTVLFKPEDSNDSFLRIVPATGDEKEKRDIGALYTNVSIPLREGKIVNLPQIGIFTPKKRENGDTFVSFMLSSSLRSLLNKDGVTIKDVKKEEYANEIKETIDNQENKDESKKDEAVTAKTNETEKGDSRKPERVSLLPNNNKDNDISSKFKRDSSFSARKPQVVETTQETTRRKSRSGNISGILLVVAVFIFILIIAVATIHSRHNKNMEEQMNLSLSSEKTGDSVDLTTLAEQHYGNSAFWIYIYEANMEKLSSPINIPQNVSLTIPDLKTEYNVDATDSGEIKKANKLAEIILAKGTNTNK